MAPQSITLPQSFNGQTRLFPLSGLVFFPSTVLPLHIFESRYCEMLEDALQGDQLISMATLTPGFEHDYHCRPPIAPVVCIGRVVSCRKTNSGMYDLMLVGLQRAQVEYEIEPVRSFRRAHVRLIADHLSTSDKVLSELGNALTDRILHSAPSARQLVDEFRESRISLATLTDVVAFHLPLPVELKLQLLGEADVLVRIQLLLASLQPSPSGQFRFNPTYPANFSAN